MFISSAATSGLFAPLTVTQHATPLVAPTAEGQQQGAVVLQLYERVQSVLQPVLGGVGEGGVHVDVVHGHQQDGEHHKAEEALAADGQQRRNVTGADELLLHHHLNGHYHLGCDDQGVP